MDALPKDIHNSEASKPAEAILRLNQLFNIESELEALPPDQKKKERLIREKPLLELFGHGQKKVPSESCRNPNFQKLFITP